MNDFSFYVPLDIVKSENSEGKEPEMRIAGYASTSNRDRQDDEIIQKGLDIDDFLNYGWFNFDHDNSKILGYPDRNRTRVDSNGFWVEGTLLQVPLAKSLWETAVALKKSNAPRKLGFSIEGKTLKRDALGRIVKAKVYNVALTANPVNPTATWDALVKSFTTDKQELEKAMESGYGFNLGESSNGSVLKPESLDSAFKVLALAIGNDEEARKNMLELKQRLNKRQNITKSELTLYFQLTKGLSQNDALSLVNTILQTEKED